MKIIITAGGMAQRIDAVRSFKNSSTGTLAFYCLEEALRQAPQAEVWYLHGPGCTLSSDERVTNIAVDGPVELYETAKDLLETQEIALFINAMAVADYVPQGAFTEEQIIAGDTDRWNADGKISSAVETLYIKLQRAPKTLRMVKTVSPQTCLVGFKLLSGVEDEELVLVALAMLQGADADLVVANDIAQIRSGAPHRALFVRPDGSFTEHLGKPTVAQELLSAVLTDL
jgi:phosphopantothenate--cysteine ligase